jgi:hypothetical protein
MLTISAFSFAPDASTVDATTEKRIQLDHLYLKFLDSANLACLRIQKVQQTLLIIHEAVS